jgi:hypothetical protein
LSQNLLANVGCQLEIITVAAKQAKDVSMFVFRLAVDTLPIILKENEIQQQMQLLEYLGCPPAIYEVYRLEN